MINDIVDTDGLGRVHDAKAKTMSSGKYKYVGQGSVTVKHNHTKSLQSLYTVCRSTDTRVIDLFIQDGKLYICGISDNSNMYFTVPFFDEPLEKSVSMGETGINQLSETKEICRTGTTSELLNALALFNEVTVNVTEKDVELRTADTILFFEKSVTYSRYDDYIAHCERSVTEELDLEPILYLIKAINSTRDQVVRKYIVLDGQVAYTHTQSFHAETAIKPLTQEYFLFYWIVDALGRLNKTINTTIGYKLHGGRQTAGQEIIICAGGCYYAWVSTTSAQESSQNMINILNRRSYVEIMKIFTKEWNKLDVICKYLNDANKSSAEFLTFSTVREGILIQCGRNTAYIRGTFQPGVKFSIELGALKLAKMLSGAVEPEIYVDTNGISETLVVKVLMLVAVRLSNLKVDASRFKYAKMLEEYVAQKSEEPKEIIVASVDFDDEATIESDNFVIFDDNDDDDVFGSYEGDNVVWD